MPTLGALLTLPCGAWVLGDEVPPDPIAMADMQETLDREIAIYRDAGLRETETGTARFDDAVELLLEGGQCIGVVVASEASWPAEVKLYEEGETAFLTRSDKTHVASAAWCDPFATRLRIAFTSDWQGGLAPTAQSLEGDIHYWVFTGRTDAFDLTSLPRGRPNEVARGRVLARLAMDRAVIVERANLPELEPVLEPLRLEREAGAWLVPRSATTWDSYRNAVTRFIGASSDHVFPRMHDASIGELPEEYDTATAEALIAFDDALWRVLAVVDPADLPVEGNVPCATIRFGRLSTDEAVDVRRFDLVSAEALATAGIAASDSFCPSDPVRVYVVPAADAFEYVVRVFANGEPRAGRRSGRVLEPPSYPPLVEAMQACDERGEHCLDAARELRDGVHVPVDEAQARQLLRRACEADVGSCGEYAEHLLTLDDESDVENEAASVLRRACDAREWTACARLGDLRRLGRGVEADYDDAHDLYRLACANQIQGACANADALELLLLLGTSDEPEPQLEEQDEPEAEERDEPEDEPEERSELDAEDPPGVAADE